MSRPGKDMVKISEQGIVTSEALLAYLQNKLSPEYKLQLEKLLEEDPFAQDALEGLRSSINQAAVSTSISSLNKKVRERTGLKERKKAGVHWVTYAWITVVLVLLLCIGFVLINFLNKQNQPGPAPINTTTIPAAPAVADTAVIQTTPPAKADTGNIKTDSLAAGTGNAVGVAPAATAVAPTGAKMQPPTKTAAPANASVQPANQAKPKADTVKNNNNTPEPKTAASALTGSALSDAALLDDANKNFNAADYKKAGDEYDLLIKRDPGNPDALYFGGICDYLNNKPSKSEANFDRLLKQGNKYPDGSKWYKALLLIKKGHSEAAKPLLQELSNGNSSYKERAIKKLAELGF